MRHPRPKAKNPSQCRAVALSRHWHLIRRHGKSVRVRDVGGPTCRRKPQAAWSRPACPRDVPRECSSQLVCAAPWSKAAQLGSEATTLRL
jgi:hypothetical protein